MRKHSDEHRERIDRLLDSQIDLLAQKLIRAHLTPEEAEDQRKYRRKLRKRAAKK